MKVSREKALGDWEREILRGRNPDPGHPPEVETRMYKDNANNEWLIKAIKRLGGHGISFTKATKKVSLLVNRSSTYLYNVSRGYYPMSEELESLIKEALENDR